MKPDTSPNNQRAGSLALRNDKLSEFLKSQQTHRRRAGDLVLFGERARLLVDREGENCRRVLVRHEQHLTSNKSDLARRPAARRHVHRRERRAVFA